MKRIQPDLLLKENIFGAERNTQTRSFQEYFKKLLEILGEIFFDRVWKREWNNIIEFSFHYIKGRNVFHSL